MPRDRIPDISRLVWPEDGNKFAWLDRLESIFSVATRAGTAYLGYQAFEKVEPGSGLAGAIISQIALRLATSQNLAGGTAGVATLSGMGILNVYDPAVDIVKDPISWIRGLITPTLTTWEYAWRRGLGTLPAEPYTPGEYDPYTGRFD